MTKTPLALPPRRAWRRIALQNRFAEALASYPAALRGAGAAD
jgi:hypothetical protein